MKTALLLFVSILLVAYTTHGQQATIWGGPFDENGSFDGGLNDWTTVGLSSSNADSAMNAVWQWDQQGKAVDGSFWDDREGINSSSQNNGAAVFDSDFLDTNGDAVNPDGTINADALGSGPAPAPHASALISPRIDCSPYPEVVLSFYQYYRNYISNCSVGVSNDDGETWVDLPVNQSVSSNGETENGEQIILDITDWAAGNDSVRLRFMFEGNSYFWIIDDVSLLSFGEFDLAIGSTSRYPLKNMNTPDCILNGEELFFETEVTNNGLYDQQEVVVRVEVLDEGGVPIWSDAAELDRLTALTKDSLVIFPEPFTFDHGVGKYQIKYEIFSLSQPDQNLTNNKRTMEFTVTHDLWSKESGIILPTDSIPDSLVKKTYALIYETVPYINFDCPSSRNVYLYFDNVPMNEELEAELYIFKLPDTVNEEITNLNDVIQDPFIFNFTSDDVFYKIISEFDYSSLDPVVIRKDDYYDWFTFDNKTLYFESDSRYMFLISTLWSDSGNIAFSPSEVYTEPVCFSYEEDSTGFTPFVSDIMPVVRIGRPITTSIGQDVKDTGPGVIIMPNPARDEVRIDHFSISGESMLLIHDMKGNLHYSKELQDHGDTVCSIATDLLNPGAYIMTILSEKGMFSERFAVIE